MARSRDSAENSIRFYLNEIGKQEISATSRPANKQRALVVDGKTLTFILDPRFVHLCLHVKHYTKMIRNENLNFKLQVKFNATVSNVVSTLCVCFVLSIDTITKSLPRESRKRRTAYQHIGYWRWRERRIRHFFIIIIII